MSQAIPQGLSVSGGLGPPLTAWIILHITDPQEILPFVPCDSFGSLCHLHDSGLSYITSFAQTWLCNAQDSFRILQKPILL